ncbi:MAG: YdbL family protein [Zymomonas mobilis]|uniref:YdbL family protein n=3 Tax=Zymomonas mobilis TaxID=542 RepID=UPI0001B703AE|nr:YdbL family protein [Zymomonas mobilis]ACV75148.1 conserved hypothetical protein [Zymomonas mobilis subsp. mobilis NCIMB 11163]
MTNVKMKWPKAIVRAALVMGLSLAVPSFAQGGDDILQSAIANGVIGEKIDGYMGFAQTPPPPVKTAVDALNIRRRAAYTAEAAKRGVTVEEWAVAVGCKTLASRVQDGQFYALTDGKWQKKNGSIALPSTCG